MFIKVNKTCEQNETKYVEIYYIHVKKLCNCESYKKKSNYISIPKESIHYIELKDW